MKDKNNELFLEVLKQNNLCGRFEKIILQNGFTAYESIISIGNLKFKCITTPREDGITHSVYLGKRTKTIGYKKIFYILNQINFELRFSEEKIYLDEISDSIIFSSGIKQCKSKFDENIVLDSHLSLKNAIQEFLPEIKILTEY